MVVGYLANTMLQLSICVVTKACIRLFAHSASSDRRIV